MAYLAPPPPNRIKPTIVYILSWLKQNKIGILIFSYFVFMNIVKFSGSSLSVLFTALKKTVPQNPYCNKRRT